MCTPSRSIRPRLTKPKSQASCCIGWTIVLVAVTGCKPSSAPTPPVSKLTPEQKLEVLVGRLKSLTKDTTSDIGLMVQREISHRFLPAKVSATDSEQLALRVPKGEIRVVTKRFIAFRSGENPITGEPPPDAALQPILHRTDSETKKYELTFQEGRWQLETQLTDESEKVWFKYALETPQ